MTQTQTTAERIQALITAQYGQTVWRSPSNAATVAAAEIDALTTECDAAQAEVMKWRKELTLCNQERFDAQTQLAEARAEVERLRLPAEAWEAYRALWAAPFADPDKRDAAETRFQVAIAADSAARARAAKESL